MRKVLDALRLILKSQLSKEQIAEGLGVEKEHGGQVQSRCFFAAGQDLPAIADMSEKEHHLFKGLAGKTSAFAQPDYVQAHHELRRKGMTLQLL